VATDSSSYDQVPYISLAFPQTYPDHLATVARIFGLSPARVSACRVLELGCASGGNLIPMAVNLPGSEFVGVDFSQHQVDEAQVAIRALGLRNIRIEAASILDVDRSWGAFDYILCHGVFSWVEPAVQDRILQIAGEQLTADGVAYVSYNTYPGWHMRQLVRDMMRYHAGQFAAAEEQVSQARALLSFLASASQGSGPYGQLLAAEAERAARASDSYLFHEHLERTNLPIYFHQFVERAERAGLLPPPVAETLERISPDILHLEQYLDFVRNRQFRQTLLCRDSAHPRRALTAETLHGLLISSAATTDAPDIAFDDSTVVTFTNGRQRADLTRPATKAAFAALTDAWPRAIAVDELCETALERVAAHLTDTSVDDARQAMLEDLFGGVMYGLIESHTEPPSCTNRLADMPRAHPVAALQAESGAIVVNAHHQMLELDPLCREVLRLAAAGSEESDEGRTAGADVADAGERLAARLEQALATLLRSAVFVE
jgi:methyltransferase-like protein/trans-aconitate methyltransferase